MRAQAFCIPQFQPLVRHPTHHFTHVHQLTTGEDILLDELPDAATELGVLQRVRGDPVVHHQSPRLEQPIDLAEVPAKIAPPDMFEHAHACDLVEKLTFGNVAIVLQTDFDTIGKSELADALAGELELAVAQSHTKRFGAIMLSRPNDEPAPATADVEKTLTRLQHELAADVIELLLLSEIQRIVRMLEVSTGVDAFAIEPKPVEIIADVIVLLDVAAVGVAAVPPPFPDVRAQAIDFVLLGHQRLSKAQDIAHLAFEIDVAFDVAPGKSTETGMRKLRQRLRR